MKLKTFSELFRDNKKRTKLNTHINSINQIYVPKYIGGCVASADIDYTKNELVIKLIPSDAVEYQKFIPISTEKRYSKLLFTKRKAQLIQTLRILLELDQSELFYFTRIPVRRFLPSQDQFELQ